MGFEIFDKEEKVLTDGEALLASDGVDDAIKEPYEALLDKYRKLFKTTKRLVKLSDRNEAELNRLAHDLDKKNSDLKDLSVKLSKYLSPQVYDSIFSGEREVQLTTERKKLTVFFSDLKDFTSTTEDLQPEDLTYLLNKYFTEMSKIALKHGATIDKFIGDAMLMFFGDPETKGVIEDAKACVRMAIEMQQRMADLQEIWRAKGYDKPFQMRIGINTGYCNVGNFGSDVRMDYTIIGSEVNLAARLEASADTGGILLSSETYALVKDIVDAEERAPIHVKGVRKEVKTYSVNGIYDHLEQNRRVLRAEYGGMLLLLDLDKVHPEDKNNVRDMLNKALERLT